MRLNNLYSLSNGLLLLAIVDVARADRKRVWPPEHWMNKIDSLTNGHRCGASSVQSRRSHRIIGGRPVESGMFPGSVLIETSSRDRGGNKGKLCNGILLDRDMVLTLTGCLSNDLSPSRTTVKVGVGSNMQKITPDRVCSRNLRTRNSRRDRPVGLAILGLPKKLKRSDDFQVPCLAMHENRRGKHYVIGTDRGANNTKSTVYLEMEKNCSEDFYDERDMDYNCLAYTSEGVSVCPGDGGGGVFTFGETDKGRRMILEGIIGKVRSLDGPLNKCTGDNKNQAVLYIELSRVEGILIEMLRQCGRFDDGGTEPEKVTTARPDVTEAPRPTTTTRPNTTKIPVTTLGPVITNPPVTSAPNITNAPEITSSPNTTSLPGPSSLILKDFINSHSLRRRI